MEEINNSQAHSDSQKEKEEKGLSFKDLLRSMKVKWVWFVVSLVVCLGAATVYLMHATPMYTRSVEILLKDESNTTAAPDFSMLGVSPLPSELLNEMFIMSSPEIMEQVVIKYNLNEIYSYPKTLRKQEFYNNSPVVVETVDSLTDRTIAYSFKINLGKDGVKVTDFKRKGKKLGGSVSAAYGEVVKTPVGTFSFYETDFMEHPADGVGNQTEIFYAYTPIKKCAETLSKQLQTVYDENRGNIATLTIACTSVKKATDILNGVVDAYNARWVAEKKKTAIARERFIEERLASIEAELGDVETNITEYKSSHRLMDMESVASLYLTTSSENQRALQELAQEIQIGQGIKNELASNDITRMLPATADIAGTNIQQMVMAYNTQVGERNAKLQSLPEESPLIQQKTEAILNARAAILASVDQALESLNKRYEAITLADRQTQAQLATAPGQAKYLMSEERKQKVKESLYVFLLQSREENAINGSYTDYNIRMVTEPFGPDSPTSPKRTLILALAVFVALLIPAGIIYIREVTNTKVRSRKDIEDLPVPFLGEVPLAGAAKRSRIPFLRRKNSSAGATDVRKVLVRPHKGDVTNEAFRMIRTNIDFMGAMDHRQDSNHGKTLMVVSLNAGSGKTFVSLNTAAIFAIKGKKTCMVDLDLRKGTVSLNVGNPPKGVTDYLIGKNMNLDDLVVRDVEGIEGFDILPEGIKPPNPTELLYSPNLERLIDELREKYDYVLFDCPPVEIVADARLLNPYIDMSVFVMRSGLFDKSDLKVLRAIYESRRYNNLAVVLNATDSLLGVYGSYGYGYHYGKSKKDK